MKTHFHHYSRRWLNLYWNMEIVCGVQYCGNQDKVERVLRRSTKMVASVRHLAYKELLEN